MASESRTTRTIFLRDHQRIELNGSPENNKELLNEATKALGERCRALSYALLAGFAKNPLKKHKITARVSGANSILVTFPDTVNIRDIIQEVLIDKKIPLDSIDMFDPILSACKKR